jgi:hypothetical protein
MLGMLNAANFPPLSHALMGGDAIRYGWKD